MSEHEGKQATTKRRRSRQTQKQNGTQPPALSRPTHDDKEAWEAYWVAQGQPWRTEPEIDGERQKYLAELRTITPNIEQGIYPFKDIKLSRADVEWLLANYGSRHSLVSWGNESQRMREGLDLRGADLRKVNLSGLPLMYIRGGLTVIERRIATQEQRDMAGVHLEKADLSDANLMGAHLASSYLERANFSDAHLENANFNMAHLQGAELVAAHLERASLFKAQLGGANLRRAYFDVGTIFELVTLKNEKGQPAKLADIKWGGVNLAIIDWTQLNILGDELLAFEPKLPSGEEKDADRRLAEYEKAVRANRQLAIALEAQGMSEIAVRFAYRAQKLQRVVLWRSRKLGKYLFSGVLEVLAGYGYRPGRSVFWYVAIVCGFALAYHIFGHLSLFPPDAFIYSLTSFHGRGFFPGLEHRTSLHDPLIMLAAIEAVVGLLIEISFIATFTLRFFGK